MTHTHTHLHVLWAQAWTRLRGPSLPWCADTTASHQHRTRAERLGVRVLLRQGVQVVDGTASGGEVSGDAVQHLWEGSRCEQEESQGKERAESKSMWAC